MSENRDLLQRIARLERMLDRAGAVEVPRIVRLKTPKTSTAWDGDARSTTSRTLIDMSAVFGVPAGVKAVLIRVVARDTGSATRTAHVALSPATTGDAAFILRLTKLPDLYHGEALITLPCNSNGDVYYDIAASGTGTMAVWLEIWGWEI